MILDMASRTTPQEPAADGNRPESTGAGDLLKALERVIQTKYSPDAVVVNAEMQILQFRGHTAPYLEAIPGEPALNLLRMAKESLVLPLRRAVQTATESNLPVRELGITRRNQWTAGGYCRRSHAHRGRAVGPQLSSGFRA